MLALPEKASLQKVLCCLSLIVLFSAACSCGTVDLITSGNGNRTIATDGGEGDDKLYYLDLTKPRIEQAIDPTSKGHEGYKFVQIEVAEVTNPKKHPLTFEVRYQSSNNEETYLGSFSLYPSDNPGKFIVATQGKLRDEGAIVLSLVTPDKIDSGDTIRVGVKKIKFLRG